MKVIRNVLKNKLNVRTEMNYPKEGIEFIDIMPLLMERNIYKEIIEVFVEELKNKKIDYILAPEARGFLLGSTVSYLLGIGCIPIRKKGKLPPTTVQSTISYNKEYGKDYLEFPKLDKDTYENKRFYIIDDIYATGNTFKSIKEEIKRLGGVVVGEGVIMNIVELNDNKDLFSLIDVNEG